MTTTNGDTEAPTKDTLMSRAYSVSQRRLREAHQDEFNTYMGEETAKLGLDWKPRLSPTEKALSDILAMLEGNPGLADKLTEVLIQR